MLILPSDPEFHETLAMAIPPHWREVANRIGQNCFFVASSDSGLLRPATNEELTEYLYGGEYDDRLESIGDSDDVEPDL